MLRRNSMRTLTTLSFPLLLGAAFHGALAGEVKVIANSSVTASTISADELKGVFLVTKTALSDGSHVEPVLEKSGATHESFVKEYLGKSDSALQTYYRSLVFTGKASMPKTLGADSEVVAYVAKTKGAIGYVGAGASTAGVKTLEVK
jgi:ABC-type phosphate transport system substrate-binding protein